MLNTCRSQGGDLAAAIAGLRKIYPNAVGNSFHLLGHAYRDLAALGKTGFAYDISCLRFNTPWLLPAWHPDIAMTLLTYCFEDGYAVDGAMPGSAAALDLDSPGIKILNFHPLNVYLNLGSEAQKRRFQQANPRLGDTDEAKAHEYRAAGPGAETALRDILAAAKHRDMEAVTVAEMVTAFRNQPVLRPE